MTTLEAIRARWKAITGALVALAVAFGVELPEGIVEQSTEQIGMVAAGCIGLYALGRVVWDRISTLQVKPKRSEENDE